ncbi:MAG: DUF2249 domain-containing protein [Verrucomicrobia bacterium]|nr:MAG: DUF2249 domain-containing protein [Verrucomicrobiota bacterium]
MTQRIITLDVRPDFRSGAHPCDKIQNALGRVADGEALRLLVPFEPVPLFEVARTKGLTHDAKQIAGGDWEVLFSRGLATETQTTARGEKHSCGCGCSATEPSEIVDVDARGLEPPQPMVKILEALTSLPDDASLSARTDRRPVHLYPILEARGFRGESQEQSDGSFITKIVRS